jgi:hypothetical protein
MELKLARRSLGGGARPVLTGAMSNIPDSFATLNQRQENAAYYARLGAGDYRRDRK